MVYSFCNHVYRRTCVFVSKQEGAGGESKTIETDPTPAHTVLEGPDMHQDCKQHQYQLNVCALLKHNFEE